MEREEVLSELAELIGPRPPVYRPDKAGDCIEQYKFWSRGVDLIAKLKNKWRTEEKAVQRKADEKKAKEEELRDAIS